MRSTPLQIGVTGLGRVGWEHCRKLAAHRDFKLVAVADPVVERRTEATSTLNCVAYARHEELLAVPGLDAVIIASPTHLHRAMAVAAFHAGKHVFLEKPMAVTVPEARAIWRAATAARRVLTVYQPHRLMAYHQQIKRLIATGKLGQIYHIKRGGFTFVRRNDWQTLQKFGGGMLNNYGAHFIDQLFDLTGSEVSTLFCRLGRVASLGDAEDVVKLVYQTKNGVLGEMDINQATPRTPYELEVYGTHGVLWKEVGTLHLRYVRPRDLPRRQLDTSLASAGRAYPRDNVRFREESIAVEEKYTVDVYADFARAVRTRSAPFVKPAETLAVMEMLARCRKIARSIIATPLH